MSNTERSLTWLQQVVNAQAEDSNLWRVVDTSLHEEYLQQALRALHEAIESVQPHE